MKKSLLVLFAASSLTANAQLFSPESLTGAAIGGIAGAVIGHNSGRHGGEGAAIGAGVGLLAGALVRNERERSGYYSHSPYHYGGNVSVGYSSRHYHHGHYRHYRPHHYSYGYYRPRVYYSYSTPVTYVEREVVSQPTVIQTPAPATQPQNVTIINNYYGNSTPISSANSLFGR